MKKINSGALMLISGAPGYKIQVRALSNSSANSLSTAWQHEHPPHTCECQCMTDHKNERACSFIYHSLFCQYFLQQTSLDRPLPLWPWPQAAVSARCLCCLETESIQKSLMKQRRANLQCHTNIHGPVVALPFQN